MPKFLAFIWRDYLNAVSYKFFFITQIAKIFLAMGTFYFLARLLGDRPSPYLAPYGGDYFSFVLIGIAFNQYIYVSVQSFAQKINEAQQVGTLEALFVTQTPEGLIILGSALYNFIWATIVVLAYLVFGGLAFGAALGNANLLSGAVVLLLTITSFSSLGILSACFILIFKKGDPIGWLIQGLAGLVGGVIYPIEVLPHWLQLVSKTIPVTYALRAMRFAMLQGKGLGEMHGDILALILFTVILLPFSLWVFRLSVRKAKRDGTLTQY